MNIEYTSSTTKNSQSRVVSSMEEIEKAFLQKTGSFLKELGLTGQTDADRLMSQAIDILWEFTENCFRDEEIYSLAKTIIGEEKVETFPESEVSYFDIVPDKEMIQMIVETYIESRLEMDLLRDEIGTSWLVFILS